MGLDLRWPIGLMFSLIGALLTIYGLMTNSNPEVYSRSLGLNINLYWGLLLLVFGASMLLLAWKGAKNTAEGQETKDSGKTQELSAHQ
jgi:hypothetical protein